MSQDNDDKEYKKVPVTSMADYIFTDVNPCVDADYHNSSFELEENAHNPMIRAIPVYRPRDEVIEALKASFTVPHLETYRAWPLEMKVLAIEHVMQVLVIVPEVLDLYDWMHIALRHRYRDAVPTASYAREVRNRYKLAQTGVATVIQRPAQSHSRCHSVFGLSGVGKTTLIMMVLSLFAMKIDHHEFEGAPLIFTQVTWLMVSCPPNGSVQTLMQGILYWFDLSFDEHNREEMWSRANIGDYVKKVVTVLKKHMVGVLIIDEIHFALRAADKTWLLGFLSNLLNENACAYVLLGTHDAKRYLTGEMPGTREPERHPTGKALRNARRAISGGMTELSPYSYDREWRKFADQLMRIDFLPRAPANRGVIRKALYLVSAGLPAFAKLAWEITQYVGLLAGFEAVTHELVLQSVARTFSPVAGLIQALRTKDYARLVDFEDVAFEEVEKVRATVGKRSGHRGRENGPGTGKPDARFSFCVAILVELGKTKVEAESVVRDSLQAHPDWTSEDVIRAALTPASDGRPRRPARENGAKNDPAATKKKPQPAKDSGRRKR